MRLKRTGREAWEGLGAILEFGADSLHRIRTIPLDLGFDEPFGGMRGRPRFASAQLGRSIIARLQARSKRFRTEIAYVPEENIGLIALDGSCEGG